MSEWRKQEKARKQEEGMREGGEERRGDCGANCGSEAPRIHGGASRGKDGHTPQDRDRARQGSSDRF